MMVFLILSILALYAHRIYCYVVFMQEERLFMGILIMQEEYLTWHCHLLKGFLW